MAAAELNNTVLKNSSALKAYYRFESGALTTDSSGNTHTLTDISDPADTTGVYGGGVILDSDDAYSHADHADFKPTGAFTIGGWVKRSATGAYAFFAQSFSNAGGGTIGWQLGFNNSNQAYFVVGYASLKTASSTATYTDGAWHHFVATCDGTNIRLYVDGAIVATTASSYPTYYSTNYVRIGCANYSGTNTDFFNGSLDDVFLVNGTALSADQIKELYEGRYLGELRPNQFGTTKALYHLSSTTDASGNNYHLTNGSAVTFTPGKFGNKATLGGAANDVLYISSNLGITSATLSFGGWFKNRTEIGAGTYSFLAHWDNTSKSSKEINYEYNAGTRRLVFQRVRQGVAVDNCVFNVTLGTANWNHIVVVMDGTNIYGYVNGNQVATAASSGNGSSATNDLFLVGCTSSSNAGLVVSNMAVADADECFVSSTALTANQIRTMYALGTGKHQ